MTQISRASSPETRSSIVGIAGSRLTPQEAFKTAVIVGSGPSAANINNLINDDVIVIAMNNAWRASARADFILYSDDFPHSRKPESSLLRRIGRSSTSYIPAMNQFGGIVYGGGSMIFASSYWALQNMPYSILAYFAADLVYEGDKTHFYDGGSADVLRDDISLLDLRSKLNRLLYFAATVGVRLINITDQSKTRLPFARLSPRQISNEALYSNLSASMSAFENSCAEKAADAIALERESEFDVYRYDFWNMNAFPANKPYIERVAKAWRALDAEVDSLSEAIEQTVASL